MATDNEGRNALHLAVSNSDEEIIKELLLHKEKLLEGKDKEGNRPLHLAVQEKNKSFASKLLIKAGADISAKNNAGQTPLQLALQLEKSTEYSSRGDLGSIVFLLREKEKEKEKICIVM